MSATTHKKSHAHGGKGKKRAKGQVKGEINVTPLIDVVLVLLIIFMVVTPMIASGVQVDLPRTSNHSKKPDDGKDVIVSVTHKKEIYVGSKKINLDQLQSVLEEEKRRNPEKSLFVKADGRTTGGVAREVMETIHKMGFDDVFLGTEEIQKAGGAP
jgi:biopolymer transport protein ExbD/biopolymer transport protein TolR